MTDVGSTIAPKSDQLNADDLIAGPRTVRITKVSANPSTAEQPIAVNYEGDNGKPYYPCKSMRRVMVSLWGRDGANYVGKSMTLYRDAAVKFGGMDVGGIRISHMSDIDGQATLALTATRGSRKPYVVKPLVGAAKAEKSPIDIYAMEVGDAIKTKDQKTLAEWWSETEERRNGLGIPPDRLDKMNAAVAKALE